MVYLLPLENGKKKKRKKNAILAMMCQLNIKKNTYVISYAFNNNEKNGSMFLQM